MIRRIIAALAIGLGFISGNAVGALAAPCSTSPSGVSLATIIALGSCELPDMVLSGFSTVSSGTSIALPNDTTITFIPIDFTHTKPIPGFQNVISIGSPSIAQGTTYSFSYNISILAPYTVYSVTAGLFHDNRVPQGGLATLSATVRDENGQTSSVVACLTDHAGCTPNTQTGNVTCCEATIVLAAAHATALSITDQFFTDGDPVTFVANTMEI